MTRSTQRALLFLVSAAAAGFISLGPLFDLVRYGRPPDYYTHIPLIPLISAWIMFKRRKSLFQDGAGSPVPGLAMIFLGVGLAVLERIVRPGLIGRAELCASGGILILSGAFVALYGRKAFREALFPFAFLATAIPLPLAWMGSIVSALVTASTGVTHLLFRAFGVPFVQEGSIFYLPSFDIEVAQECSGIRSSLALVITSILAAQIFLSKLWKKAVLVLSVFPVTVLKNGIRIATLYLLSFLVDERIIAGGFLHRSGGFIFFGLGLVLLGYILWLLRSRVDSRPGRADVPPNGAPLGRS